MWTQSFFKHTHVRIRARCRCSSARSRSCARAQKWTRVPVCNNFCKFRAVHCFVLATQFMFQNGVWQGEMEWLCTQSVTYWVLKVWTQHHFVPVPRYWFPSTKCGQPLRVTHRILKVWTQHRFVPVPSHWFPGNKCGQSLIPSFICPISGTASYRQVDGRNSLLWTQQGHSAVQGSTSVSLKPLTSVLY